MTPPEKDHEERGLSVQIEKLLTRIPIGNASELYIGLDVITREIGVMDFSLVQQILREWGSPLRLVAVPLRNPMDTRAISPLTNRQVPFELGVTSVVSELDFQLELAHYYGVTLKENEENLSQTGFVKALPGTQAAMQQKAGHN